MYIVLCQHLANKSTLRSSIEQIICLPSMSYLIREVTTFGDSEAFFTFPHRIHSSLEWKSDSTLMNGQTNGEAAQDAAYTTEDESVSVQSRWIPPLDDDFRKIFYASSNPMFSKGECVRFVVRVGSGDDDASRGRVVGRFALMRMNIGARTGELNGIGYIELEDEPAIAKAMIDFAKDWFKKRGVDRFRGPIHFGQNMNHWGLLIDNHLNPPIVGMPYHPPYYQPLIEVTGARKYDDHKSFEFDLSRPLPERLLRITQRVEGNSGVSVRPLNHRRIREDVRDILTIYNAAWSDQDIEERVGEFTPIFEEDLVGMIGQLRPVLIPQAVLIAYVNGQPASFIVSIPDLNEFSGMHQGRVNAFNTLSLLRFRKRAKRLRALVFGTVPEYRKMGLEALVFTRGIQLSKKAVPSLQSLEGAWVSEKNWLMQGSLEALGCVHHKTHRTYEWAV